jgi:hypothetical protein
VAGKGHETGQYVAGAVLPFDDRAVTAAALAQRDRDQRDRDQRDRDQRDRDQRDRDRPDPLGPLGALGALGADPLGPLRAEPLTSELDPWTVNR